MFNVLARYIYLWEMLINSVKYGAEFVIWILMLSLWLPTTLGVTTVTRLPLQCCLLLLGLTGDLRVESGESLGWNTRRLCSDSRLVTTEVMRTGLLGLPHTTLLSLRSHWDHTINIMIQRWTDPACYQGSVMLSLTFLFLTQRDNSEEREREREREREEST